jgi:predicted CoA-binding protein
LDYLVIWWLIERSPFLRRRDQSLDRSITDYTIIQLPDAIEVVAVIGAEQRRKFGNRAVRAYLDQGYTVVPINPHEREVEGLKAYASVLDVPGPIDMASFYVPPDVGEEIIGDIARKQIAVVWLNPGAESDELIARARALSIKPIVACSIVAIGRNPYSL